MKYYIIIVALCFSLSCEVEKDEIAISLSSFSQTRKYDNFSNYKMTLIDDTDEKKYNYNVSFMGSSTQKEYLHFEESILFKPFMVEDIHHWIPVESHTTILIDITYFDFSTKVHAGFGSWTSKNHWSRIKNPDLANELYIQSTIQITNSNFVSQPNKTDEKESSIHLESPGGTYGITFIHDYTSDSLLLDTKASGQATFTEFLHNSFNVDEEIILEFSEGGEMK